MEKVSFTHKKKKFQVNAKHTGFFGRASGLMFKSKESASALLFKFKRPGKTRIHSLFVFFPFLAVWLKNNKIVDFKVVKPFDFSISSKKSYDKLIEIPINKRHRNLVKLLVGD
jgi:uncharacterized membrane protein (UPF0127 family)